MFTLKELRKVSEMDNLLLNMNAAYRYYFHLWIPPPPNKPQNKFISKYNDYFIYIFKNVLNRLEITHNH